MLPSLDRRACFKFSSSLSLPFPRRGLVKVVDESGEMAHAELLRMKEEALNYSADLRRALMDLADSHAALIMALEPLMDQGAPPH